MSNTKLEFKSILLSLGLDPKIISKVSKNFTLKNLSINSILDVYDKEDELKEFIEDWVTSHLNSPYGKDWIGLLKEAKLNTESFLMLFKKIVKQQKHEFYLSNFMCIIEKINCCSDDFKKSKLQQVLLDEIVYSSETSCSVLLALFLTKGFDSEFYQNLEKVIKMYRLEDTNQLVVLFESMAKATKCHDLEKWNPEFYPIRDFILEKIRFHSNFLLMAQYLETEAESKYIMDYFGDGPSFHGKAIVYCLKLFVCTVEEKLHFLRLLGLKNYWLSVEESKSLIYDILKNVTNLNQIVKLIEVVYEIYEISKDGKKEMVISVINDIICIFNEKGGKDLYLLSPNAMFFVFKYTKGILLNHDLILLRILTKDMKVKDMIDLIGVIQENQYSSESLDLVLDHALKRYLFLEDVLMITKKLNDTKKSRNFQKKWALTLNI